MCGLANMTAGLVIVGKWFFRVKLNVRSDVLSNEINVAFCMHVKLVTKVEFFTFFGLLDCLKFLSFFLHSVSSST